ncbi:hypothetical protein THAOC_29744 [Thalassiosira oceanica]|uniref:Uncharacterized protein n=1 Tax=Thalassiosira oceanica TaxID=159749 RepID=K0RQJ4_THAOC|nr:hypothetical protein THAOC_29744 [Thalassiosira oceanica]|eukprot:EJK51116.1 hypothetical protein THAOC_29744 [Thalassiosira oceanica]
MAIHYVLVAQGLSLRCWPIQNAALNAYFSVNVNIGDEGAAALADGLRNNQRLTRMSLEGNNITERGWNAFSSILCDTSNINATYNSNHTLQSLGGFFGQIKFPQMSKCETILSLNNNPFKDKSRVAVDEILRAHRHLDMRPLFGRELGLLPYVVAWLDHFAKSRPDLKLSSILEFVRAMPMKVTDGVVGKRRGRNVSSTVSSSLSPMDIPMGPCECPWYRGSCTTKT